MIEIIFISKERNKECKEQEKILLSLKNRGLILDFIKIDIHKQKDLASTYLHTSKHVPQLIFIHNKKTVLKITRFLEYYFIYDIVQNLKDIEQNKV